MEFTNFTIGENDANRRLDRVIRKMLPAVPLSKIYSLIRHGSIRLNGKKTSQSTQLIQGDILQVSSYFLKSAAPLPSSKLSTNPDKLPPPIRLNSQKAKVVASHLPHLAIIYKDAVQKLARTPIFEPHPCTLLNSSLYESVSKCALDFETLSTAVLDYAQNCLLTQSIPAKDGGQIKQ